MEEAPLTQPQAPPLPHKHDHLLHHRLNLNPLQLIMHHHLTLILTLHYHYHYNMHTLVHPLTTPPRMHQPMMHLGLNDYMTNASSPLLKILRNLRKCFQKGLTLNLFWFIWNLLRKKVMILSFLFLTKFGMVFLKPKKRFIRGL